MKNRHSKKYFEKWLERNNLTQTEVQDGYYCATFDYISLDEILQHSTEAWRVWAEYYYTF